MTKKRSVRAARAGRSIGDPTEPSFGEVVVLTQTARQSAIPAMNTEVIALPWCIGEYPHHRIEADG